MFTFNTKAPAIFPKAEKIKDVETQKFGEDMARILTTAVRSILDDFKMLERVQRVDTLPTASDGEVGKMYLLNGTGAGADTLHICIDSGGSGFCFRQFTLS